MKTARERAEEWLTSYHKVYVIGIETKHALLDPLEKLLKEQDKITRQACAEAVLNIDPICETPNGNDAISPDDAHDACMNVKAV